MRQTHLVVLVCVLAALWSTACDDDDNGRVERRGPTFAAPSPISFNPLGQSLGSATFFSPRVTAQRESIAAVRVPGAACPARAPFLATFNVDARAGEDSDLLIREVQMNFVDRAGVPGGSATVTQRQLEDRFGSTRIPAVSARSFPFSFPLGCVGQPVGTLSTLVFTVDSLGREFQTPLVMAVR